jgi:uncharacterized protein (TIGR00255 family)
VIRSMTGYGRKEILAASVLLTIEIRSVNNRFIDVQVKAPRSFTALEPRIKKAVQERCSRGRFDVFISRNGEREGTARVIVDERLLEQYIAAMRGVKDRFGLGGEIDIGQVTAFPGLISVGEEKEDIEAIWEVLSKGLGHALSDLDAMRSEEGAALIRDMSRRLNSIEGLMQAVKVLSPATVEQARIRMSESLRRLLNEQPDPARIAQEIALLAERTDVTEELTRLQSHLRQFRSLIADSTVEAVGRKLDFLLQEMGREANTIASKAMDAQIAHHVVDIKAELEKIREQAQNIE